MGIETAGARLQPKKRAWSSVSSSLYVSPSIPGHLIWGLLILSGAERSRNIALMSIVGVVSGAWLTFRAMAPKKHAFVASDEELEAMRGHHSRQTDQDGKAPRPPDGTAIRKF